MSHFLFLDSLLQVSDRRMEILSHQIEHDEMCIFDRFEHVNRNRHSDLSSSQEKHTFMTNHLACGDCKGEAMGNIDIQRPVAYHNSVWC